MQSTSCPSAMRRSQRWEPMNPAPPVTRTRFGGEEFRSIAERLNHQPAKASSRLWPIGRTGLESPLSRAHYLFERPELDQPAVVHSSDQITVANRRQAMRDDDDRAALMAQAFQSSHDCFF